MTSRANQTASSLARTADERWPAPARVAMMLGGGVAAWLPFALLLRLL